MFVVYSKFIDAFMLERGSTILKIFILRSRQLIGKITVEREILDKLQIAYSFVKSITKFQTIKFEIIKG